jgi:hypothetical protein
MAKWTVEQFTEELKNLLGENLLSLVLYGSRAAGDHLEDYSDTNLMALVKQLDVPELLKISKAVAKWLKQGNPPPLLLTADHLRKYAEVFPIEISDIQENHRELYGQDPFAGIVLTRGGLKQKLEHELQGKLLQLKTRFMMTQGKEKAVRGLMTESISSFLVLLKNALWLYGEKPPIKKMDALQKLGQRFGLKTTVFETVELLKKGERIPNLPLAPVFEEYLKTLEAFTDKIIG